MRWHWRSLRKGELDFELIWLAVTVVAAGTFVIWLAFALPWPQCTFRQWTGLSCVTCGATRGSIALLHGNFAEALRLNPLVFFAIAATALFDLYALVVLTTRTRRLRLTVDGRSARTVLRAGACGAVALNWIYLLVH